MSTKDIQFTDNKLSVQQGSYVQKTPFLIEDILHQRSNGDQLQQKISINKISNVSNNGDKVTTEINNKITRNNNLNELMSSGTIQGNEEDYRKIIQHERWVFSSVNFICKISGKPVQSKGFFKTKCSCLSDLKCFSENTQCVISNHLIHREY